MNNLRRIIACTSFACLLSHCSDAQSPLLLQAHKIIDTLASATMDGRGYVDSGEWKAATFIQHAFSAAGLSSFSENYTQQFYLDANTFPGNMSVQLDKKSLIPGKDFLVDPVSSGTKGKFKVIKLEKSLSDTSVVTIGNWVSDLSGRNLKHRVIAFQKENFTASQWKKWNDTVMSTTCFGAAGCLEFSNNKLTWDASQTVQPFFYLHIKDEIPVKKHPCLSVDIQNKFKEHYPAQNIIGYIKGSTVPDSFIVFTAHYDHLGQMGHGVYFPGANDNASGTAMLLTLADYFSKHPVKYSIAFMAFSGEESGLVGSHFYVEHPLFPLGKIKFLVNVDIVGTGEEGVKVVNATEFKNPFDTLVKLNDEHQYLKVVSPRGKTANSDHYFFYAAGVPSFFIYTMGGIAAYHDIYDRAETLPLTKFEELCHLMIDFVNTF